MGIKFKINFDTKKLSKDMLTQIEKRMKSGLDSAIAGIEHRTKSGKDFRGQSFKPYHPAYARQKAGHKAGLDTFTTGKKRKQGLFGPVPNLTVDLTLKGNMLQAIHRRTQIVGGTVIGELFFTGDESAKARGHMTGTYFGKKTGKKREFFRLSKKQQQRLTEMIKHGR